MLKSEVKIGTWIRLIDGKNKSLIKPTFLGDYKTARATGFFSDKPEWRESALAGWNFYSDPQKWRLATEVEVSEALKREAMRRYPKNDGEYWLSGSRYGRISEIENWTYFLQNDKLFTNKAGKGGMVAYHQGVWAKSCSNKLDNEISELKKELQEWKDLAKKSADCCAVAAKELIEFELKLKSNNLELEIANKIIKKLVE